MNKLWLFKFFCRCISVSKTKKLGYDSKAEINGGFYRNGFWSKCTDYAFIEEERIQERKIKSKNKDHTERFQEQFHFLQDQRRDPSGRHATLAQHHQRQTFCRMQGARRFQRLEPRAIRPTQLLPWRHCTEYLRQLTTILTTGTSSSALLYENLAPQSPT